VPLIEVHGCIFDADLLAQSHGFESLDAVGRETFVNHLHLTGENRVDAAERVIKAWKEEMAARWPAREFRIYRQFETGEVTIRFHAVRPGMANWCEEGVEISVVASRPSHRGDAPDRGGG